MTDGLSEIALDESRPIKTIGNPTAKQLCAVQGWTRSLRKDKS